jgi:hypothetical protein
VLPPGDWEKKNILPLNEIMELRRKRQAMKYAVLTGGASPPPEQQVMTHYEIMDLRQTRQDMKCAVLAGGASPPPRFST